MPYFRAVINIDAVICLNCGTALVFNTEAVYILSALPVEHCLCDP
jgi:hypothetical protein